VPEKFSATANFRPDGSFTYKFDGTAVDAMAAMVIRQKGALSAQDEAGLKREADGAAKAKGVHRISYLGAGRFDVSLESDLQPGQLTGMLDLVSVTRDKAGVFSVTSAELKPKDQEGLNQLGIRPDGSVAVILPSNAKVISQNADGTPGLFSKAYSWKIGSLGQRPSIKFTLAP
jgi:hypothetical protein